MLRNFFADPDFFRKSEKGLCLMTIYHRHRLPNFRTLKGWGKWPLRTAARRPQDSAMHRHVQRSAITPFIGCWKMGTQSMTMKSGNQSTHCLILYIYIPALVELNYFYYIYICNDIPCYEIIISDNELSKGPLFSEKTNKSQLVWWDFRKEKHSMTVRIFWPRLRCPHPKCKQSNIQESNVFKTWTRTSNKLTGHVQYIVARVNGGLNKVSPLTDNLKASSVSRCVSYWRHLFFSLPC